MSDSPNSDLTISPRLTGQAVQVVGKPDWGVGTVARVQSTTVQGEPLHRVTVDFPVVGRKTVVVPPARLIAPQTGPSREEGWLDRLAGRTLDDRLRKLPQEVLDEFGPPSQRLAAALPLFSYTDDAKSILKWARWRGNCADPLSVWSRDELAVAFAAFCEERDSHVRNLAALLQRGEGRDALLAWIEQVEPELRPRVLAALRKPI